MARPKKTTVQSQIAAATAQAARGDAQFAKDHARATAAVSDKRSKAWEAFRADSWQQFAMGAGIKGKDKLEDAQFGLRPKLGSQQCSAMFRQNWLAKLMVYDLAKDCTRAGYTLELAGTEDENGQDADAEKNRDITTAVYDHWERIQALPRLTSGMVWALVFGGAVGLLYTDDEAVSIATSPGSAGLSSKSVLSEPLNESALNSVKQIVIVDSRFAIPDLSKYTDDPDSPNFGLPEYYQVTPYGNSTNTVNYRVHWSRLLRFEGVETDMLTRIANLTWGDSIYESAWDPLMRYGMAFQGAAVAAAEFAIKVMKVKDLAGNLGSDQLPAFIARMYGMKMSLGAYGIAPLDADGETLEFLGQPVTGLHDLLEMFKEECAGAIGRPQSKIWGNHAGAIAGSEEDGETWGQKVQGWQKVDITPNLHRLTKLLFLSKDGPTGGVEPAGWSIKPNPITAPNLTKELEQRELFAKIMHIFYADGVLEPSEIRASMAGAKFNFEVVLDQLLTEVIKKRELEQGPTKPAPLEPRAPIEGEPSPAEGE